MKTVVSRVETKEFWNVDIHPQDVVHCSSLSRLRTAPQTQHFKANILLLEEQERRHGSVGFRRAGVPGTGKYGVKEGSSGADAGQRDVNAKRARG